MAEQRTYQGHVYTRNAPGEPWVLSGPAAPAASGGPGTFTIGTPDPHRAAAEKRAADADARAARDETRRAAEWAATHNPDGTPNDGESALNPETTAFYAQQILAGGQMPTLGMGKAASAARQEIMREVARQAGASGLSGADLARQVAHYKAGSAQIAQLEKMLGTISASEQTALANGQQFLDRSAELPGQTRFPIVNSIVQSIERHTGNDTIAAADVAMNTFANEYAKVISGSPSGAGTLSDSARHEAMAIMRGDYSLAQKQAAFNQMKADMANRMVALHQGINNAYTSLTQKPGYAVPESTSSLEAAPKQDDQRNAVAGASVGGAGGGQGGGGASAEGGTQPPGGQPPPPSPWNQDSIDRGVATGGTKTVFDPTTASRIDALIRAGRPSSEARAYALSKGYAWNPGDDRTYDAAVAHAAKYPQYKGSYASAHHDVGQGVVSQLAGSPAGTMAAHHANNFLLGIPGRLGAKDALDTMAIANPSSAALGDVTGSIAGGTAMGSGLRAASGIVANPTVASILARPITADIAYGSTTGAMTNDDPIRGFVEGGAGAVAGHFGGQLVGRVTRGLRGPADPLGRGERAVFNAVDRTGADDVLATLRQGQELGVPLSLADASSDVNSLTGAATRRSPVAAQLARDTFGTRGRGQYDRFTGAIERDLGPVENIPQRSEDLITQARTAAGPLYDTAYAAPGAGAVHPQIEPLLNRPSMRSALGRARTIAAEEGRDPQALGFDLDAEGNVVLTRVPSWQTLDYAKRGMDDVLEGYRDRTTGRLMLDENGRAIDNTRRQLLSTLDAANPDYAAARATYAGPAAERDALAMGQRAVSLSPDQLQVNVNRATPSQLEQQRLGFQSQLAENAGKLRYSSNPFESVLGTPAMEQRLTTLYPEGSGSDVARLLLQRDVERNAAASANRLVGNSMTAERGLADEAFANGGGLGDAALEIGANVALGQVPIGTAIRGGLSRSLRDQLKLGVGRRGRDLAEQIAPIAIDDNTQAAIDRVLDMQGRNQAYQAILDELTRSRMVAGGRVGAGVGTGVATALMGP